MADMKIAFVGYRGCGKSNIINRLTKLEFCPFYERTKSRQESYMNTSSGRYVLSEICIDVPHFDLPDLSGIHFVFLCIDGDNTISIRQSGFIRSVLLERNIPFRIIVTKSDVSTKLNVNDDMILTSSKTGTGIDKILESFPMCHIGSFRTKKYV